MCAKLPDSIADAGEAESKRGMCRLGKDVQPESSDAPTPFAVLAIRVLRGMRNMQMLGNWNAGCHLPP